MVYLLYQISLRAETLEGLSSSSIETINITESLTFFLANFIKKSPFWDVWIGSKDHILTCLNPSEGSPNVFKIEMASFYQIEVNHRIYSQTLTLKKSKQRLNGIETVHWAQASSCNVASKKTKWVLIYFIYLFDKSLVGKYNKYDKTEWNRWLKHWKWDKVTKLNFILQWQQTRLHLPKFDSDRWNNIEISTSKMQKKTSKKAQATEKTFTLRHLDQILHWRFSVWLPVLGHQIATFWNTFDI